MQQVPLGHGSVLVHFGNHRDAFGDGDALRVLTNKWLVGLLSNLLVVLGTLSLFSLDFNINTFLYESVLDCQVGKLRLLHQFILGKLVVFH